MIISSCSGIGTVVAVAAVAAMASILFGFSKAHSKAEYTSWNETEQKPNAVPEITNLIAFLESSRPSIHLYNVIVK